MIWVIHIRGFRIWVSRIRLSPVRLMLHIYNRALAVPQKIADYVPGSLQFFRAGPMLSLFPLQILAKLLVVPASKDSTIASSLLNFINRPAFCRWWLDITV